MAGLGLNTIVKFRFVKLYDRIRKILFGWLVQLLKLRVFQPVTSEYNCLSRHFFLDRIVNPYFIKRSITTYYRVFMLPASSQ
jgi:hypothetical protein